MNAFLSTHAMHRTSTFKTVIWLLIVVGSALSVKTLRRHPGRQLTSLTSIVRKASVQAVRISQITRPLFLP